MGGSDQGGRSERNEGRIRETGEAEAAGKAAWVGKVVGASGEWAILGHFCQDVDEVVQP